MVAAAVIGGSALLSAGTSLLSGSEASSAAEDAAYQQQQMYYQTRSDLSPYNITGQNALTGAYNIASGSPTGGGPDYVTLAQQNLPGQMTQAQLEQTPGYQWQKSEGLKAVQSAAAARGLGVSGASLKGAATYVSGLASANYQKQFENAQTQFKDYIDLNTNQQANLTNQFDRYNKLVTTGENAAAQTGTAGTAAAETSGKYTSASGQYTGAATTNAANALSTGVNNYLGYDAYTSRTNANTSAATTSYAPVISPTTTNYLGTGWSGSAASAG